MNCEIQLPASVVRVRAGQLETTSPARLTAGHFPRDPSPFKIIATDAGGDFDEISMSEETARQMFDFLSTQLTQLSVP